MMNIANRFTRLFTQLAGPQRIAVRVPPYPALRRHASVSTFLLVFASLACVSCGGSSASPEEVLPIFSLRERVQAVMDSTQTPGAVVVVHSPRGSWSEAFGTRSFNGFERVQTRDHFRIASLTKTWTATVILQLVQSGALQLSDVVSRYIADIPNGDQITIEQLLSMRSGLYDYANAPEFQSGFTNTPQRVYSTDDLLAIIRAHPVLFPAGQRFDYTNSNPIILGSIIEKLTGMSVAQAIRERIFQPLSLSDSFMPSVENTALPEFFARGYSFAVQEDLFDEDPFVSAAVATDATDWSMSGTGAAGMGISSAENLAIYVERLVAGGTGAYLDPSWQARRLESCFPIAAGTPGIPLLTSYCLGLGKYRNYYGHTGSVPGYTAFMGYDPVTQTTLVVLASASAGSAGVRPGDEIARQLIDLLAF